MSKNYGLRKSEPKLIIEIGMRIELADGGLIEFPTMKQVDLDALRRKRNEAKFFEYLRGERDIHWDVSKRQTN